MDRCDVSADMVALCREKAERDGLSPNLYVQPMHEIDLPRRYEADETRRIDLHHYFVDEL